MSDRVKALVAQMQDLLDREPVESIRLEILKQFAGQLKNRQIAAQVNKLLILAEGADVQAQRQVLTELAAQNAAEKEA